MILPPLPLPLPHRPVLFFRALDFLLNDRLVLRPFWNVLTTGV